MTEGWFSYDPEVGFELHETEAAAKEFADACLEGHRDRAVEGWHEGIEAIRWGEARVRERVIETYRLEIPEGVTVDEDRIGSDGVDYSAIQSGWEYMADYGFQEEAKRAAPWGERARLPQKRLGRWFNVKIGPRKYHIWVGEYRDGRLGEVSIKCMTARIGSELRASYHMVAKFISIGLQYGAPIQAFIDTMDGVKGEAGGLMACDEDLVSFHGEEVLSAWDGLAKILTEANDVGEEEADGA